MVAAAPSGRGCLRPGATRESSGVTLMEMLIVLALLGLILVPLFGFAAIGFSETAGSRDRNAVASDVGLAQTAYARDAATATLLTDQDPGSYGACDGQASHTVLVRMVEETEVGGQLSLLVTQYTVSDRLDSDGAPVPGEQSLFRRQCLRESPGGVRANSNPAGPTRETQLVRNIEPGAATATEFGSCSNDFALQPGPPESDFRRNCSTVDLRFTPVTVPLQTELRGRRVAGSDSALDITGSIAPTVRMVVSPDDPPRLPTDSASAPYELEFEAEETLADGWTLVSREWTIRDQDGQNAPGFSGAGGSTLTWDFDPDTHSGRYVVRITVTAEGEVGGETVQLKGSTFRVIDPANRPPVIRLNTPMGDRETLRCRPTVFSVVFGTQSNPNASYDPDDPNNGNALQLPGNPSWNFENATGGGGPPWTNGTVSVQFDALGNQQASLTLRDALGASSTYSQNIYVNRGSVNFSATNDLNDGQDVASPQVPPNNPAFTRLVGAGGNREREVFFRPKDWRCGANLVNITLFRCAGAVYATVPEGDQPCPRGASGGTRFKCQQNVPPVGSNDLSQPPRWTYDIDKDPCTPTPYWSMIAAAPSGSAIDPSNYPDGDIPTSWRYRARFAEPDPLPTDQAGTWFVMACSDMAQVPPNSADPNNTFDPAGPPPQRCVSSLPFQRS